MKRAKRIKRLHNNNKQTKQQQTKKHKLFVINCYKICCNFLLSLIEILQDNANSLN